MYKVALVEDDSELSRIISLMLTRYQYEVTLIESFDHVIGQIIRSNPDVVLLDINLPGIDGFHICKGIRQQSSVPIIIISARNTDADQILGVELGADDYMTKPFSVELLHSKIKASIRRAKGNFELDNPHLVLGDFVLDYQSFTMSYRGHSLELTKNELKLLKLLVQKSNEMVSRERLLSELWDDVTFVDHNTLNVNVSRIKNKLNNIGIENAIQTKRGYGYRFVPYWMENVKHE